MIQRVKEDGGEYRESERPDKALETLLAKVKDGQLKLAARVMVKHAVFGVAKDALREILRLQALEDPGKVDGSKR